MADRIKDLIRLKMRSRGISPPAVDNFLRMVDQVRQQESAYIPVDQVVSPAAGQTLEPPVCPSDLQDLCRKGMGLMSKVAVVKLNGGRSTTMGGQVPKGILTAKNGLSYLEIILKQIQASRHQAEADIPLILMNSFFTHEPTLDIISRFNIPAFTFMQNQVPRLDENSLAPLETGTDDDWAPPGHGDVYPALKFSGLLDRLLTEGRKWAFMSNLDNLAATVEPWILGMIDEYGIEFLLEVTDRTELDRKGGTLVVRGNRLELMEIAQVAPGERQEFMDINRFKVFNTNNVWVDLEALAAALNNHSLKLPVIQNRKKIDGCDIIQLETAMGAAMGAFARSRGLKVGRERFFPTKKVEDLFVLQSDACVLDSMYRVRKNPQRSARLPIRPSVLFASDFLDSPLSMCHRFEDPSSVSLVRAHSFDVSGGVFFETDVRIEGHVTVAAPAGQTVHITRGSVLRDGKYP